MVHHIHGFAMFSEVYAMHYNSEYLEDKINLLGIDVLGHGQTKTKNDTFTYWDTAIINI
jgi:pimeloyl-ACP methyl ester carboxylesterase